MQIRARRSGFVLPGALVTAAVAPGCMFDKKSDDIERFREAIPQSDAVTVPGPETAADGQSRTAGIGASQRVSSHDSDWADGPWAKYYGFTRQVRDGVNNVAGVVLGAAWIIVHTQPTSVDANEATWGPWTDSLEPATWRFRIQEVADDEYDYFLEGRPKTSEAEGDFRPVLTGKGWARSHEKHGDGFFEIDLDAARDLDPFKHGDDSGTVRITHDLPSNITDNLFALPKTIRADVRPSDTDQWFDVTSTAHENRTGTLEVNAFADTDDTHLTALEDVNILSRWRADGAGRADITLANGDVPATLGTVTAVECWGSDFSRVFYSDSVEYEHTAGDAAACAYDAAP